MFAFAIWDERRGRLLLARDRFGEKPLFYARDHHRLVFASEVTALTKGLRSRPDVAPAALDAFFVFGYVPGPGSILDGIRQLEPGHLLTWEHSTRRLDARPYWRPPVREIATREPVDELAAEAGRLLERSIRGRLLADVPLGVFLSGGVDSTLIAALAARQSSKAVKTFTVGYDTGAEDERAEARRIAALIGTDHRDLVLTGADAADRVPRLLAGLDQPLADQAIVPLHAVAEFAKREVTVAIGGEGADELFGGYPRYGWLQRAPSWPGWIQGSLPRTPQPTADARLSGRFRRALALAVPRPLLERHVDWVTAGRRGLRAPLYGPRLLERLDSNRVLADLATLYEGGTAASVAKTLMRLDQLHWLPDDVLTKADRAGMLVSLEIRTPYLHRELAEFASTLPAQMQIAHGGKRLLRRLLKGLVPSAPQRRKVPFLPPAAEWLRGPMRPLLRAQLDRGALYEEGWFERDQARHLSREHAEGRGDWSHVLWPLLAAGLWLDRYRGLEG